MPSRRDGDFRHFRVSTLYAAQYRHSGLRHLRRATLARRFSDDDGARMTPPFPQPAHHQVARAAAR